MALICHITRQAPDWKVKFLRGGNLLEILKNAFEN